MEGNKASLGVESEVPKGGPRARHHGDAGGTTRHQGEFTMSYQLDAVRATIDERLREAEMYRLVRSARPQNRVERVSRRARQVLSNLTA